MRHPTSPETRETNDTARGTSAPAERRGLTPLTLFLVLLLAYVMIQIELVLVITLLALVFATVIERPVQLLERRHVPRAIGILTVYAAIIGVVVLLIVGIAPIVSDQFSNLRDELPGQLEELQAEWNRSANPVLNGTGANLLGQAREAIARPPDPPQEAAVNVLTGLVGGILGALSLLVIAFYYLMEKPLLKRLVLDEFTPATRSRVERVWDDVEHKVGGWIRGQLTLSLIIGVLATIGYGILDVRFWPLLGLIAGITEIIPIIGPWLGGIPAVIVALTDGWQKAAFVVGFILLLQFLENTVLVPRVMRGAVGLTPLTVFVAVLAGTNFIGPAGAVLAIPIAALIQVILTDYLDARRLARHRPSETVSGWRWMRGALGSGQSVRVAEPWEEPPSTTPANGTSGTPDGEENAGQTASKREPDAPPDTTTSRASIDPKREESAPRRGPSWSRDLLGRPTHREQSAPEQPEPTPSSRQENNPAIPPNRKDEAEP
jgi:predicted PurR-regulated permease PerM